LEFKDIQQKIIVSLLENPLKSLKELSENVSLSVPTLKKRLQEMYDDKIIIAINAHPKVEELGLKRVHVISTIKNKNYLKIFEKACDLHPYTRYRSTAIGTTFNCYSQFEIPDNETALDLLELYFQKLYQLNIILDYKIYKGDGFTYHIYPNLSKYNPDDGWMFDWDSWNTTLINARDTLSVKVQTAMAEKNKAKIDPTEFTPLRFDILRYCSIDGTIKQSVLTKKTDLQLSKSEANRQYNYVKDNMVDSFELYYNRNYFDLNDTNIFFITNVNKQKQAKLMNTLLDNPPPFRFSIDLLENNSIFLYGNLNYKDLYRFVDSLWSEFDEIEMYRLNSSIDSSIRYYFWPDNFDFEKKTWKIDYDYMLTNPINEIKNDLNVKP